MSRDAVVAEGGEIMVSEDSTLSVVAEKRAALSSLITLALPWMRALVVKAAVVEADNATARVAAAAARMCCFVIRVYVSLGLPIPIPIPNPNSSSCAKI